MKHWFLGLEYVEYGQYSVLIDRSRLELLFTAQDLSHDAAGFSHMYVLLCIDVR